MRTGLERHFSKTRVRIRGDDDHANIGNLKADSPSRFEPVDAWHRNIHQDHAWAILNREADRFLAVVRFSNDFNVHHRSQQPLPGVAYSCVVVGDENCRCHICYSISAFVPTRIP
jgi:hypothetical protein